MARRLGRPRRSSGAATALEKATFVVFDLETTGLSPRGSRIVEIGAQRVEALECRDTFETLVNPGVPVPAAITALTGIGQRDVHEAPAQDLAVRRFLAFSGRRCSSHTTRASTWPSSTTRCCA